MIKHIPWKQMLASWVGPMRLVEVLTEVLQAILQAGSARWSDRPAPCWAESVIVGRMYRGEGSPTWFTIWVDTGSTRDVRDAPKRVIYDFDASSQVDAISSGGAIISALLSRWGRAANPDDIVQAARWMKNKGVDPHHLWRGGGARILTANQFPLPESTKQQLTPEEVDDLISRWEQQGN